MQHFEDGGEVEFSEDNFKTVLDKASKKEGDFLSWDWDTYTYRISGQNITIEKWLMQDTIDKEYRIIETSLVDSIRNFKKIKLLRSYVVEV